LSVTLFSAVYERCPVSPSAPGEPAPLLGLRERSKRERRARIENAAREVFREKGFAAATTREIAARAGVGTGTLFVYARDKQELLRMVFRDQLEELSATSFASVPPDAPLIEQLMHVFQPRFAFWGADPRLSRHAVQAAFDSRYGSNIESRPLRPAVSALHVRTVELIERNQANGKIGPSVDPQTAARLLLDIYYHENREWIADPMCNVEDGVARLRTVLMLSLRALV